MSKKSKAASKQKNLQRKRAIKAANKAKYESWRLAGENTKSKRFMGKTKRVKVVSHPQGSCGNMGCKRCDPNRLHRTYLTKRR